MGMIGSGGAEVGQTLRRLRRRPAFAGAVITVLGVGMAAVIAMFSIVDGVLLRPLPWKDADRLVRVFRVDSAGRATNSAWNRGGFTWDEVRQLQDAGVFEKLAMWSEPLPLVFGAGRESLIRGLVASSTFLDVLGVQTILGRGFSAEDDHSATGAAIITYEAWQRRFGGRPDIIGTPIVLGDMFFGEESSRTVIGVLAPGLDELALFFENRSLTHPRGFVAREGPEVFVPLERSVGFAFTTRYSVLGSISADRPVESVQQLADRGFLTSGDQGVRLEALRADQTKAYARPLVIIFGGSGLLLLVACSNAVALLLSRARDRQRELSVRLALGAGRFALFRQLFLEHAILVIAAGTLGTGLAWLLLHGIIDGSAVLGPRVAGVAMSTSVVTFVLGSTTLTALGFGIVPTLLLARARPENAAAARGGATPTRSAALWRRAVLGAQVSLVLVLLMGAGLFAETVFRLRSVPLHFQPAGLSALSLQYTGAVLKDSSASRRLVGEVVERLAVVPGVVRVAAANAVPFLGRAVVGSGMTLDGTARTLVVQQAVATEDFFETMSIPVVKGTSFANSPVPTRAAAIVSEGAERLLFEGDALGRRLTPVDGRPQLQVVGVVPDLAEYEAGDAPAPTIYVTEGPTMGIWHVMIRASMLPEDLFPLARRLVSEVSPQLVVTEAAVMNEVLDRSLAAERLRALLASGFSMVAIALVAVGLFALATYTVTERRREFGLRLALGATQGNLWRLVVRDVIVTIVWGIAAGIPLALLAGGAARALLFGVEPASLHLILGASGLLLLVGLVAALLPASRAWRTDPAAALRDE